MFVFSNIMVECAALYLRYAGFFPPISEPPQFVIIFSPLALTSIARDPEPNSL